MGIKDPAGIMELYDEGTQNIIELINEFEIVQSLILIKQTNNHFEQRIINILIT